MQETPSTSGHFEEVVNIAALGVI